jgi:hypothetical protein
MGGEAMIWYEVRKYGGSIREVEVVKVTAKQIFKANGNCSFIRSSWANYFPTWEEAKDHLIGKLRQELMLARYRVKEAEEAYNTTIVRLKEGPPEESK